MVALALAIECIFAYAVYVAIVSLNSMDLDRGSAKLEISTLQFKQIFVPPSADLHGLWNHCKLNPKACLHDQIRLLHGSGILLNNNFMTIVITLEVGSSDTIDNVKAKK